MKQLIFKASLIVFLWLSLGFAQLLQDVESDFYGENETEGKRDESPILDDLNIEFRLIEESEAMDPAVDLDFNHLLNGTQERKLLDQDRKYDYAWDFKHESNKIEFDSGDEREINWLWAVTVPTVLVAVVLLILLFILFKPTGYLCKVMSKPFKEEPKKGFLRKK